MRDYTTGHCSCGEYVGPPIGKILVCKACQLIDQKQDIVNRLKEFLQFPFMNHHHGSQVDTLMDESKIESIKEEIERLESEIEILKAPDLPLSELMDIEMAQSGQIVEKTIEKTQIELIVDGLIKTNIYEKKVIIKPVYHESTIVS